MSWDRPGAWASSIGLFTSLTDSGLTATYIPLAGTGGLLGNSTITQGSDGGITITTGSGNGNGLTFGSLGTATKMIDGSSSGLSGATDYWIYNDAINYWKANGHASFYNPDGATAILNVQGGGTRFQVGTVSGVGVWVGVATAMAFGNLAGDGEYWRWSTDKMGLGTTTPMSQLHVITSSISPVLFGGNRTGSYTSVTFPTANKDYVNVTGIGTANAVGSLLIVTGGTGATTGIYRIKTIVSADSVQVDHNIHNSGTDITNGAVLTGKDVISMHATDATNGQMLTSWSAQNKPMQLGGTVLGATSGLTSEDITIGGRIGFPCGTNDDGIVFGSLGTATRMIDGSASGMSGEADYWIYNSDVNNWAANGMFSVNGISLTGGATVTGNGAILGLRGEQGVTFEDYNSGWVIRGRILNPGGSLIWGQGTSVGSYTSCTFPTANKDYINKTGIGTGTSVVGEQVHVTGGTGATTGLYRIIALISANSIQVDRNIHNAGADITNGTCAIYKDVISISQTDGTYGQLLTSWSAQNKPLQLGGTVLAATVTLTSKDLYIGGDIGFSGETANGTVATTITSLGPTGTATTIQGWIKIIDSGGTARYIPYW